MKHLIHTTALVACLSVLGCADKAAETPPTPALTTAPPPEAITADHAEASADALAKEIDSDAD